VDEGHIEPIQPITRDITIVPMPMPIPVGSQDHIARPHVKTLTVNHAVGSFAFKNKS
jgi:hypothetical protein